MSACNPPYAPKSSTPTLGKRPALGLFTHACLCRLQTPELTQHAQYTEAALMPCVRDINALHKNASSNNLQAVRKKYAQEKQGAVSGIPPANL